MISISKTLSYRDPRTARIVRHFKIFVVPVRSKSVLFFNCLGSSTVQSRISQLVWTYFPVLTSFCPWIPTITSTIICFFFCSSFIFLWISSTTSMIVCFHHILIQFTLVGVIYGPVRPLVYSPGLSDKPWRFRSWIPSGLRSIWLVLSNKVLTNSISSFSKQNADGQYFLKFSWIFEIFREFGIFLRKWHLQ